MAPGSTSWPGLCSAVSSAFNGHLPDELLNSWQFYTLLEAQVIIGGWRIDYSDHRPHSAHGDLAPSEFARAWTTPNQPALA